MEQKSSTLLLLLLAEDDAGAAIFLFAAYEATSRSWSFDGGKEAPSASHHRHHRVHREARSLFPIEIFEISNLNFKFLYSNVRNIVGIFSSFLYCSAWREVS